MGPNEMGAFCDGRMGILTFDPRRKSPSKRSLDGAPSRIEVMVSPGCPPGGFSVYEARRFNVLTAG